MLISLEAEAFELDVFWELDEFDVLEVVEVHPDTATIKTITKTSKAI